MPSANGSETPTQGSDDAWTLGPGLGGVIVTLVGPVGPVDPATAAAEMNAHPGPVANAILPTYSSATPSAAASPGSAPAQGSNAPFQDASSAGAVGRTASPTAGDDYLVTAQDRTEIHGGDGADTIQGTIFDDYLRGDDGSDSVQGGSAFDDINGNSGDDTIDGGSGGNDWLVGGRGDDSVTAHHGQNILLGSLGNDTLQGGDGGDQVRGGQGDDSIAGGAGSDYISGDRGNDTETGGAGADIFHSFSGAGVDRVLNFHAWEGDRVMLDPGTTYTASQVGADTVVDMGDGDQMILVGVTLSSLPNGWIFLG